MVAQFKLIAALSLALLLQACITNAPPARAPSASYFWLPLLGISDTGVNRIRDQVDAMLTQRGYIRGGGGLALAVSTDAPRSDDGSLGLGSYAGGYAYYTPPRAPHGMVVIQAFDAETLEPVWSTSFPAALIRNETELHMALSEALRSFPLPDVAGLGSRETPDARGSLSRANSYAGRT